MKKLTCLLTAILCAFCLKAQQSENITFTHDGLKVYGTFSTPAGAGPFPVIIINPGSGANDRDGTLPLIGGNAACLYPGLLNKTLKPYLELGQALVDSGFAVLRYDKIEYTYTSPTALGAITFHKLWLPVESAIGYVKTRADVDTTRIILLGHSEGSAIIPFIAKDRSDVAALISLAGARTPFDSLLAYQLVNIAQTCGGNVPQAQAQANQILAYYNLIRTNTWNASTPALFGVPASAWYDYVQATDPVAEHYNEAKLPTLFVGLGLDINVPPAELVRFQNEVTITGDFWSIPGLVHYMAPNNDPHVSQILTDTIVYWLRQKGLTTAAPVQPGPSVSLQVSPNPAGNQIWVSIDAPLNNSLEISLHDTGGKCVLRQEYTHPATPFSETIDITRLPVGVYFVRISGSFIESTQKIIKR